jgi:hypothetical protein
MDLGTGTITDVLREVIRRLNCADDEISHKDAIHAQLDVLVARNLLLDLMELNPLQTVGTVTLNPTGDAP